MASEGVKPKALFGLTPNEPSSPAPKAEAQKTSLFVAPTKEGDSGGLFTQKKDKSEQPNENSKPSQGLFAAMKAENLKEDSTP